MSTLNMKTYARIDSGLVAELFETDGDITEMFHPDLIWVDCTSVTGIAAGWEYANGIFSAPSGPTLSQTKEEQAVRMSQTCAASIVAGFTSSALGKEYIYASGVIDQANLGANVMSSLLPNLPTNWTTMQKCRDPNGIWDYVPHTATQIQQVGVDGKSAVMAFLLKNSTLQDQIAAATTVAQAQAVIW